jgi:hypothetical protein
MWRLDELTSVRVDISDLDATRIARQEKTVVASYTRRHERNVRLRWGLFALFALAVCVAAAARPEQRRMAVNAAEGALGPQVYQLVQRAIPASGGGRCAGPLAHDAIQSIRVGIDRERDDTEKAAKAVPAQPRRLKAPASPAEAVDLLKKAQDEAPLQ